MLAAVARRYALCPAGAAGAAPASGDDDDTPPASARARRRASLRCEPRLSDLLDDPICQMLMARDGVSRTALATLIATVRERSLR
jgi:hypothetical protein